MSVNKDISRLKILVIDDEIFTINLCVRLLKEIGCDNVSTADNGRVAIDRLIHAREPVDIIICDLKMPEMDGFEFMQYMADNDYTCGLIFLSGKGDYMLEAAYHLARKKKVNILGAITKPIEADVIEELLKKFVSD
ncbi:MAG: YesN/AraC family two-component response regulator [Gammaproteobacteria bacterium]|jgi:YesN/AraC family two-component response regulator